MVSLFDFVVWDIPFLQSLQERFRVDILVQNYNGQTAYNVLKFFLDLCTPPSKSFLRALAETATDLEDKKLLLFLVSQQGIIYPELRGFREILYLLLVGINRYQRI
jgi:hypothetical protein